MKLKTITAVFLFYAALAFPSFYFVYKFGDPIEIAHDFFQYYRLYNNWEWSNVNAPFNMRLISSFFVWLFHQSGIFYDSPAAFDKYIAMGFDKQVFFSAVFFNYLTVAATATVIYFTTLKYFNQISLSIISGALYLLGSGILFFELMPCTDAFSVLLFALLIHAYRARSFWIYPGLLASVFQREYILLAFILIAGMDYLAERRSFFSRVGIAAALCFVVYFVLRKTLFYTPALSFQTSPDNLWQNLWSPPFDLLPFLRQTLLTLNLLLLYGGILAYKIIYNLPFNRRQALLILLLLIQIIIISFAANLGNNAGRYFFIASPLILFELVSEGRMLVSGNPQRD